MCGDNTRLIPGHGGVNCTNTYGKMVNGTTIATIIFLGIEEPSTLSSTEQPTDREGTNDVGTGDADGADGDGDMDEGKKGDRTKQRVISDRLKYMYILNITVGDDHSVGTSTEETKEDSLTTSNQKKAKKDTAKKGKGKKSKENTNEESKEENKLAVNNNTISSTERKVRRNGMSWTWSRVLLVPSSAGISMPSERLWFGCAFGKLLLTGQPLPVTERTKYSTLILHDSEQILHTVEAMEDDPVTEGENVGGGDGDGDGDGKSPAEKLMDLRYPEYRKKEMERRCLLKKKHKDEYDEKKRESQHNNLLKRQQQMKEMNVQEESKMNDKAKKGKGKGTKGKGKGKGKKEHHSEEEEGMEDMAPYEPLAFQPLQPKLILRQLLTSEINNAKELLNDEKQSQSAKEGQRVLQLSKDTRQLHPTDNVVRSAHRIIVYGGRSADGLAQQDLWSLHPITGEWDKLLLSKSQRSRKPHPRFGHTMCATQGLTRICLFGGSDGRARLSDAQILQLQIDPCDGVAAEMERKRHDADPSTIVQPYSPHISQKYDIQTDSSASASASDSDSEGVAFGWVRFGRGMFREDMCVGPSCLASEQEHISSAGSAAYYLGDWDVQTESPSMNGKGTAKWKYGSTHCEEIYEGEWGGSASSNVSESGGMRHGNGNQVYCAARGGGSYSGQWKDDMCDGVGTRLYCMPSRSGLKSYAGEWKRNEWCGQGVVTFVNGTTMTCDKWGYDGTRSYHEKTMDMMMSSKKQMASRCVLGVL